MIFIKYHVFYHVKVTLRNFESLNFETQNFDMQSVVVVLVVVVALVSGNSARFVNQLVIMYHH